jgi:uncharacterized membrane protein YfcA
MMIYIVSFLAALFGALGLGGGFILLIYLTAVEKISQFQAQGTNLIFFIPIALVSLFFHIKNKLVLVKDVLIAVLFGTVGVFLGFYFAMFLGDKIISYVFAGVVFVVGVKELFAKKKD